MARTPSASSRRASGTTARRNNTSSSTPIDALTFSDMATLPCLSAVPTFVLNTTSTSTSTTTSPVRPPSRLATLPQALFHHILAFTISDSRPSPEFPRDEARLHLRLIAQVSTAWYAHASELASQLLLSRMTIEMSYTSRRQLLAVRRKMTLRRAFLRELQVVVTPDPDFGSNLNKDPRITQLLAAALKDAPKLELLDLRGYDATSEDIATVLKAAATHCPLVQSLLLPPLEPERTSNIPVENPRQIQLAVDALYYAMQKWHEHGTHGGLRQLRLPNRQSTQRFATSTEFLRQLATYAPRMELLYMNTRKPGGLSSDKWIVDRSTWAQFCATCVHLRAFDWSVAPYATSFFQIFGQHVKPQLTELTLAAVPSWAWYTYYQGVGAAEAAAVQSAGVGAQARDIHHVLRACPALTKLKVDLHSPRIPVEDYGGRVTVVRLGGNNEDPRVAASKNTINQQLFGDAFIDELCTSCPLVGEIALALTDPLGGLFSKTSEPITTFTDRALIRLATLRYLFVLVLKSVNVTGKGLFELINSAANEVPGQRDFDLRIGDDQGPCEMGFYRALEQFLTCLQQNTKPLRFQNKKLVLHVRNAKSGDEPTKWSETYLTRLRTALKAVRAKYPTLQFRIEMSGLTTKSFQRIAGFGVFTRTAMPYSEYEWTDLQHGALVEGALLRQELMGREDEYEEEDEEENDYYEGESDYYDESDYDEENDHPDYDTGRVHYPNGLQSDDDSDDYDDDDESD